MAKEPKNKKAVRIDDETIVILGPAFAFWFSQEDDLYNDYLDEGEHDGLDEG